MSDKESIYNYEPLWGNWKVDKIIGEGSFGTVYKVYREDMGNRYESAVKIISIPTREQYREAEATLGSDESTLTSYFEDIVNNIIKEVSYLYSLSGNSNIINYQDHMIAKKEDGIGWDILIRMEYVTSLRKYLSENQLTRRDIIKLGIDICSALEVCSKKGIIHRDIKDENIFVSGDGIFKLGDFGIAREFSKSGRAASMRGTPLYMAPEVMRGEKYDPTIDIYSLGIVMYKLLNMGRLPLMPVYPEEVTFKDSESALDRRLSGEVLPMPLKSGKLLGEIVLKACAYNPADRYLQPDEMKLALEKAESQMNESELDEKVTFTVNKKTEEKTEKIVDKPSDMTVGIFNAKPSEEYESKFGNGTVSIFSNSNNAGDNSSNKTNSGFEDNDETLNMSSVPQTSLHQDTSLVHEDNRKLMLIFLKNLIVFTIAGIIGQFIGYYFEAKCINLFNHYNSAISVALINGIFGLLLCGMIGISDGLLSKDYIRALRNGLTSALLGCIGIFIENYILLLMNLSSSDEISQCVRVIIIVLCSLAPLMKKRKIMRYLVDGIVVGIIAALIYSVSIKYVPATEIIIIDYLFGMVLGFCIGTYRGICKMRELKAVFSNIPAAENEKTDFREENNSILSSRSIGEENNTTLDIDQGRVNPIETRKENRTNSGKRKFSFIWLLIFAAVLAVLFAIYYIHNSASVTGPKVTIIYQTKESNLSDDYMIKSLNTIKNRYKVYGFSKVIASREGQDKIKIEVPASSTAKNAADSFGKAGLLKFVGPDGNTIITNDDIKNAYASYDVNKQPMIKLEMNDSGKQKFADATKRYLNQNIAIYLDDQMLLNPFVETQITDGKVSIFPMRSIDEARIICAVIKSGSISYSLDVIECK